MSASTVYVWKTEVKGNEARPEVVSDASYRLLSGIGLDIAQRQVLIKPNVTIPTTRESGIVTDCAHVDGIVRWLLDNGYRNVDVSIGEGGGGPMDRAFYSAGYTDLACAYDIGLHSFNDLRLGYAEQKVDFIADRIEHTGRTQRIARRAIDEKTFVINAPKLKTHNAMAITICVKNLMGTQHKHDRSLCSLSAESARKKRMDFELRFAHEMCNLYQNAKPEFNMVDGVIARMGSGFHHGENYPLGLTVAGIDGYAVDFACAYFMGFNPEHLLLFKVAHRKGLAPGHIDDVDIKLVSVNSITDVKGSDLEKLSSPRGFWVKYHREWSKRRNGSLTLEEYNPKVYRKKVAARNPDHGEGAF